LSASRTASQEIPVHDPHTVDDVLLDQAFQNAIETFRALARGCGGACEEGDGLITVATGAGVPFLNPTFVTHAPANPRATFARVERFYEWHGVSPVIYARNIDAATIDDQVRSAGFSRTTDEPGMLLDVREVRFPPDLHGLEITTVRDIDTLRSFTRTVASSFELPHEALVSFDSEGLLAIPNLTMYLGMIDGQPVATAALFVSGHVAGLHVVGTVPEHRRKGIGAAMSWRVVRDGVHAGCDTCVLTASDLGRSVYAGMGFRHASSYAAWERA
jgi:GNAT superfamily N-acetyltransferase